MWMLLALMLAASPAHATRIKDVGQFYGVRDNQLSGAGLVVGLQRTGDSSRNEAAIRALATRLQGHGMSLELDDIISRNVALVMVSATLRADDRTGSRIDVTVASTGDATSLESGVLLLTPLLGTDGKVHAIAEGPMVVGGYTVGAAGNAAGKNRPTVGRIAGGATIELELENGLDYASLSTIDYVLSQPDFSTSTRLAEAVNTEFGTEIASPSSASTIALTLPDEFIGKFPMFAARIEALNISVDTPARVIINERTGTVVMGADVKVSAVAVAHGGLTIEVRRYDALSQPAPFSGGTTAAVRNTVVSATEADGQLLLVEGIEIGELISALNDMGVKPRDLIVILEAVRSAGALHAEIVTL
jgi:flagellar P-ring protein FlgI